MDISSRILSFDIGIKNLAYCFLENTTSDVSSTKILDWRVINLMTSEVESTTLLTSYTCSCALASSTKKNTVLCGKVAKYCTPDVSGVKEFLCDRHAKSQNKFLVPKKTFEVGYLKKQKRDTLVKLVQDAGLQIITNNPKKDDLIQVLEVYYMNNTLKPISDNSNLLGSAKDLDLITIGRNMMIILDRIEIFQMYPPTHIIMENQISTIASRMKTIQGELTMYFLMRFPLAKIEYISSKNKLKDFISTSNIIPGTSRTDITNTKQNENQVYRKHKSDAITYTRQIITSNSLMRVWEDTMNHKKKDDLADCFLQGIWFVKKRKYN